MNTNGAAGAKPIVCFMWRPEGRVLRDGGFRRAYAILERLSSHVDVSVIDRHPSPLSKNSRFRVVEYRVPRWITTAKTKFRRIGGAAEALYAASILLLLGGIELQRRDATVYVPNSELPWLTAPAWLLGRLFRRRIVLVNHNTKVGVASLIGRLLWDMHRHSNQVITVSQALRDELRLLGVTTNVAVNPLGFDAEPEGGSPRPIKSSGAIYIGRLEKDKGLHDLAAVWSLVIAQCPTAVLRVVGYATPTNEDRFRAELRGLGLEESVQMVGIVGDLEKWRLLSQSRICLFLSRVEGWGIVPLEAISVGVPTVVYDLPCYRESLAGLEGCYKAIVGDHRAAAEAVLQILTLSDEAYRNLSAAIRAGFHYEGWDEVAMRELQLIEQVRP